MAIKICFDYVFIGYQIFKLDDIKLFGGNET
jgi:hypothetical protein